MTFVASRQLSRPAGWIDDAVAEEVTFSMNVQDNRNEVLENSAFIGSASATIVPVPMELVPGSHASPCRRSSPQSERSSEVVPMPRR